MTATVNASTSAGVIVTSDTSGALALQTAGTTALTISSAQVVNFANAPTVAGSPIGASQATATTLGTVYAKQTTGGGTPFLTAFGYNAGVSTTGGGVTAFGTEALYTNSTGTVNTAVGYQSLKFNSTGVNNTSIGGYALTNATGSSNTGVGQGVMYATSTGSYNTAMGDSALGNNTASNNTAIGYQALTANTTGTPNTAVGYQTLYTNTTGFSNISIGYQSGYLATGNYSTFIGWKAGYNNTAGAGGNIFVGYNTGYANTSGDYNTAIGQRALQDNTTGGNNTALGLRALISNTLASNNTAVGYYALSATTTGANNVAMGDSAAVSLTGSYNCTVGSASGSGLSTGIGNTFFGMQAGAGGYGAPAFTTGNYNVSIGMTTGCSAGSVTNSLVISSGLATVDKGSTTGFINPNGGGVYQGNNSSSWSTTSDRRLKKNIVDNTIGLDAINAIQVRNFEYRTEDEVTELPKNQALKITGVQIGAIAQELQQILPDCVKTETTGVMSVDTTNITWHLINAVKELSAELNALKAKVGA